MQQYSKTVLSHLIHAFILKFSSNQCKKFSFQSLHNGLACFLRMPWFMVNFEYTSHKHNWTPIKYLNVLHHNRTQKKLTHFFLNLKYFLILFNIFFINIFSYQLPILDSLDMSGHFHQNANFYKLWCLPACKYELHS